jgi:hypothetical protein
LRAKGKNENGKTRAIEILLPCLLALLCAPAAFAEPVLDCVNRSMGAEFHVGVYANQPVFFTLNAILVDQLERQGSRAVPASGSGGEVRFGANAAYSVNTANGYLSVTPADGDGYELRFVQYRGAAANFSFNRGECRKASN